MFLPCLARALAYVLSIGFLLGTARAAVPPGDPGREILPVNDGWGSLPTASLPQGTTGGASAAAARTVTVTNRKELVAALAYPDPTPKLIYVKGIIDVNVDDAGNAAFLQGLHAARSGHRRAVLHLRIPHDVRPRRPARHATIRWAARKKRAQPRLRRRPRACASAFRPTPRFTAWAPTPRSSAPGSTFAAIGGSQPMNVIVRNISFQDTADCFPEWSPDRRRHRQLEFASTTRISVSHATHVWIDHNRFADLRTRDETQPLYFGHRYQVHDGLLDITNESDLVTVSWNQFASHDKAMLIGNSDSAPEDRERLRVTLHHNLFDGIGQRTPRVRYGKVHVYNNLYRADKNTNYRSSWGAGVESQIYAENNYFEMSAIFGPMEVIDGKKGTRITAVGNCWREKDVCEPTDFRGGVQRAASIRT